MREQIEFSNSPPFRSFMEGLRNYGSGLCIHGIFIEPHPMWRGLVDARRTSGLPIDRGPPYWPPTPGRPSPAPYDFGIETMPEAWKTYAREAGKQSHPFIVTVWIFPLTAEQMQDFGRLDQYTQRQPFFVRFQQRPMAQLAASVDGSSEITAHGSGSLGGFLQDQSGKHWGVTCGHVASAVQGPFTLEDVGGTRYPAAGTVVHSNYLPIATIPASGLCNPYVSAGNPDTDGALLELRAGFTASNSVRGLGVIDEIFDRKRLNSGSPVCMSGVKSGVEDYEIGGYGVTVKVRVTSGTTVNYHCFSHVFEIHDPTVPPGWMPSKAAQTLLARPLLGDSGSWICFRKETAKCAYFGNLIAVENLSGIATFADSFLNWARTDHKLDLKVL